MRKKIKGLIMMAVLLICFSVPAAAATESFHFEQKTDSVQVGKTKELTVYNHGKKVAIQSWQPYPMEKLPQKAGEMFRFLWFMEGKKFPVKCIHIISSYTQILPDIKQPR